MDRRVFGKYPFWPTRYRLSRVTTAALAAAAYVVARRRRTVLLGLARSVLGVGAIRSRPTTPERPRRNVARNHRCLPGMVGHPNPVQRHLGVFLPSDPCLGTGIGCPGGGPGDGRGPR